MMNSLFAFYGNILFVGGTMIVGTFIASFLISQTLYSKEQLKENIAEIEAEESSEEEEEEEEEEDPEFESLYSLEDKVIRELNQAEKEALKNKHCSLETPLGMVLLTYIEPYFIYYTKSGSIIPYRFLDVVARKFVLEFDCLEIYKKMEEEKEEAEKEEKEKEEKKEADEKEEKEASVFVVKKKKITAKKLIVTKKMNKFKYGGQIEDFNKERRREELEPKKMTFSDYKKIMKKSK